MATWTDPATLPGSVGDPVSFEDWNAVKNNPVAIAEGATGAPKIAIDYDSGAGSATAVITDETDTDLVLKPDGAGGVAWGSVTGLSYLTSYVDASATEPQVTVGTDGLWLVWGTVFDTSGVNYSCQGLVTNGAITNQVCIASDDTESDQFTISTGVLSLAAGLWVNGDKGILHAVQVAG